MGKASIFKESSLPGAVAILPGWVPGKLPPPGCLRARTPIRDRRASRRRWQGCLPPRAGEAPHECAPARNRGLVAPGHIAPRIADPRAIHRAPGHRAPPRSAPRRSRAGRAFRRSSWRACSRRAKSSSALRRISSPLPGSEQPLQDSLRLRPPPPPPPPSPAETRPWAA